MKAIRKKIYKVTILVAMSTLMLSSVTPGMMLGAWPVLAATEQVEDTTGEFNQESVPISLSAPEPAEPSATEEISSNNDQLTSSEGGEEGVMTVDEGTPIDMYANRDNSGVQPRDAGGKYNVDEFSGVFNYSYTLQLPAGRANLQPSLALNYNHRAKNKDSYVGYGWSLNLPSIERENRTGIDKLYDENYFTLNLGGTDRLEPISIDGSGYGTYGKLVESDFSKIEYISDNKWLVTDKMGTVYTFGASAASRQDDPNNSSHIYRWMLEEVRDTNDNYVRYEYFKSDGQIYPKKIIYTGHGTTDGIFTVNFEPFASGTPTVRTKTFLSYQNGFPVTTKYNIDKIDVKINNQIVTTYDWLIDNNNLLNGIAPKFYENGQQSIKDQAQFTYINQPVTYSLDSSYAPPSGIYLGENILLGTNKRDMFIDINGDSFTDYIRIFCGNNTVSVTVFENDGSNGWRNSSYSQVVPGTYNCSGLYGVKYSLPVAFAELNGDSLIDMVTESAGFYINTGSGWSNQAGSLPVSLVYISTATHPLTNLVSFSDMNGDGYDDIIYVSGQSTSDIYIRNAANYTWILNSNYHLQIDFNSSECTEYGGHPFDYADINGDGLLDIFYDYFCYYSDPYPEYINQGKAVYLNTGTGWQFDANFVAPVRTLNYSWNNPPHGQEINYLSDLDGDGNFNLLNYYRDKWVTVDGEHCSGQLGGIIPYAEHSLEYCNNSIPVAITDLNSDGVQDVIHSFNGSNSIYIGQGDKSNLLEKINFQSGDSANIYYGYSAKEKNPDNSLLNPVLPYNLKIVKEVVVDDGQGNQTGQQYVYSDGQAVSYPALKIKDVYGFSKVKKEAGKIVNGAVDLTDNNTQKIISYYDNAKNDGLARHGKLANSELYNHNDAVVRKNWAQWQTQNLGNNRNFAFKQADSLLLDGHSQAKTYYYDFINGNILAEHDLGQVNLDATSGVVISDISGDEKNTDYDYALNETKHILSAPKNKTITDTMDNKAQDLYYDNLAFGNVDKVNLTKEDYKSEGVEVNRTFNNFGLVDSEVTPEGATTSVAYDTDNLYPATKTNSLGQTTSFQYNLLNSQPAVTIDPNGAVTENTFDDFGRLTRVQISDPANPASLITKQEIIYHDFTDGGFSSAPELSIESDTKFLWRMDGVGGSTDKSREVENRANLIEYGNPSASSGFNVEDNGAYNLDGQDDYLTGYSTDFNFGYTDFSIETWIKTTDSGIILMKWPNAPSIQGWYLSVNPNGYAEFAMSNGNDAEVKRVKGNTDLRDGYWHYVAVTRLGDIMKIYADGNLQGQTIGIAGYNTDNTVPVYFGAAIWGQYHNISLDEVRLSNMALTADRIENYFHSSAAFVPGSRYRETKDYFSATNFVTGREHYDGLGRVIQKKGSLAASGQFSTVDIKYDVQGRVERQSLPYLSQNIDYSTPDFSKPAMTYTYDVLNRVLAETTPVGVTTYSYNGLTTTIIDANNHRKDLTKDAYGNLIQVKEYNNNNADIYITNYEYTLTNKLAKITDAAGNIRNFTYDALDNLISQDMVHRVGTTPAATTYTHDKNGNVLTETSFKGDNISYTYDSLNRVLNEKLAGTNKISYTYDQGTYNKGQLTFADYGGGNSQAYDYDVLGRLKTLTVKIENVNYVLSYKYDLAGNLTEITYPNNYKISYTYNSAGQVSAVSLDQGSGSVTLASNIAYNVNGQMTHLERANNVVTDYTYDSVQAYRLTRILTMSRPTKLQDLNYTYDNTGNILTLIDNSNTDLAKSVTYGYDDLNRLTSAVAIYSSKPELNYNLTYDYDSIGNMTSNSSLGAMNYVNNQPHQLTTAGNKHLSYDAAGNVSYTSNTGESADIWHWDWRNRLVDNQLHDQGAKHYYQYDHNNQRFLKYTTNKIWIPDPQEFEQGSINPDIELTQSSVPGDQIQPIPEPIQINPDPMPTLLEPTATSSQPEIPITSEPQPEPIKPEISNLIEASMFEEPTATSTATSTDPVIPPDPEPSMQYDGQNLAGQSGHYEEIVMAKDKYVGKYFEKDLANNSKVHIFLNGQNLATINNASDPFFVISDHLGSNSLITDNTGSVLESSEYSPFGVIVFSNKILDTDNDYKFTGHEYDDENALQYFGARYYDNGLGRFSSIDPLMIDILNADKYNKDIAVLLSNPQELNSYAYAINNPVVYLDPSGNASIGAMFKSFVSSVTTFISNIFNKPNSANQTQVLSSTTNQCNGPIEVSQAQKTTTWDSVSNERIKQLDPRLQQPVVNFINNTESELDTQLRVTQGYRSIEEQDKLYNQSRTNPPTGPWVTNAEGGQSYHNYGLAIDVVVMKNGQANWKKPISQDIANIANKQGFEWGGNWAAPSTDYPHFQMTFGQSWQDLLNAIKK
ncbi:MAG: hypothetical protein C3F02_03480 [Parcubacteria group bacterium]|nr:MAG: hypothetical protein C3F02_03480 [Parcubacteria group bacterium]